MTDPDLVAARLEDAAHYPGGRASGVAAPASEAEVADLLRSVPAVLAVGAQSSLTGGATPMGSLVLSTGALTTLDVGATTVRAGAGVTLQALQEALAPRGLWLPPVPTYLGATVGGAVATNAAGATTFKYGSIRDWVRALTVVLADGERLSIARGDVTASPDGRLTIETGRGPVEIPVPPYRMPVVPKCSAGYYAAPGMDLVDLFVGSEGTLGVICEATLAVAPLPAGVCWALVPVVDEPSAIALVDALRRASQATWATRDPRGLDVAAVEHLDRRSIEILREDGADRRLDTPLPSGAGVLLLLQVELHGDQARRDLWADLAASDDATAPDTPLVRLCRLLRTHGVFDDTEIVLPGNARRIGALVELREAVPAGVNRRVALAQEAVDTRITKTAADMIAPFDRFGEMMLACRRLFEARGLDIAVWGHISDGNVHPNVIPASYADVERGRQLILELARGVIAMGGSPLAEHGVGRNPVKQQLLGLLYGPDGVEAMRRVKRVLDP
ncbi:MAG: FAD-binding oxidoreductase, partial [Vicinamibacteria bacterium]